MLTVLYRFVGGFITMENTSTARMIFSTFMALCLAFAMLVKGYGFDIQATVFAASFMLTFAGRWIPHGFTWKIAPPWGYIYMSLIGFVRVALWLAPAIYFEPDLLPLCLFGLLQGGMYAIGRNLLDGKDAGVYHIKMALVKKTSDDVWCIYSHEEPSCFAKGWTEWGEVLTGELCYSLPYILFLAL